MIQACLVEGLIYCFYKWKELFRTALGKEGRRITNCMVIPSNSVYYRARASIPVTSMENANYSVCAAVSNPRERTILSICTY